MSLLAAGSGASAQAVAVSSGLSSGGRLRELIPPVLTLGVTYRNVSLLDGYGVNTRLLGDLGPRGGVELSGLVSVPLDAFSDRLNLYVGPGVALDFLRPVRVRPTLIAGLDYDLDGQLSVYGEGSYQILGLFRVRAGVTYTF